MIGAFGFIQSSHDRSLGHHCFNGFVAQSRRRYGSRGFGLCLIELNSRVFILFFHFFESVLSSIWSSFAVKIGFNGLINASVWNVFTKRVLDFV